MPGLQASRTSTAMAMENTAVIELCDGRSGTKSPWREFAEKMAIFAGYSDQCSSGSEHQPDSACLVDMVLGFMEESEPAGAAATPGDMAEDRIPPCPAAVLHQSRQYSDNEYEILEGLANAACPAERIVRDETIRALRTAFLADRFPENEESKCRKRRAVMNHLRNVGYNAAVCKTRGKYAGSFPSGKNLKRIIPRIVNSNEPEAFLLVKPNTNSNAPEEFLLVKPSTNFFVCVECEYAGSFPSDKT